MKSPNISKFIIALLIPQAAGLLGTLATSANIATWYAQLAKPSFTPPNWLFGPVWTILFLLMGVALYLVWVSKAKYTFESYLYFSLQLTANVLWSFLFFYFHNPFLAFIDIIVLWLFILGTLVYFYKINHWAGWLLGPYLLWVSFAAVLNAAIITLN